jgi:hypothetical protein
MYSSGNSCEPERRVHNFEHPLLLFKQGQDCVTKLETKILQSVWLCE